jgi:hypothetical protein
MITRNAASHMADAIDREILQSIYREAIYNDKNQ